MTENDIPHDEHGRAVDPSEDDRHRKEADKEVGDAQEEIQEENDDAAIDNEAV